MTGTKGRIVVRALKVTLIVTLLLGAIAMMAVGIADLTREPQVEKIDIEIGPGEAEPPVATDPPQENPTPDAVTEPPSTFTNEQPAVFEAAGMLSVLGITDLGFEYENYCNWRISYRTGWNKFIEWGRFFKHGLGEGPGAILDPAMMDAIDVAYGTYCCMTWTRLSGFPGSYYATEDGAYRLVKTCLDNDIAWEPALAIIGFESTYGLAGGSNDFGILWGPGRAGQVEDYIRYIQHFGIDGTNPAHIARNYNPSSEYARNLIWVTQQIQGEAY